MNVKGQHYRTIWVKSEDPGTIQIIDQRKLPHQFEIEDLKTLDDVVIALKDMHVRGAGLIGAAAGYGMYLAVFNAREVSDVDEVINRAEKKLIATRPTAINLKWAVSKQLGAIRSQDNINDKINTALKTADMIADENAEHGKLIGEHGVKIIEEISEKKNGETVNILTHCNAGWLAFVDYGSATAPIYNAFDKGLDVHVWVDETRPRNQGSSLTAWELGEHGVPHTIIADNTGGHLMQNKMVDMAIVGTDRTTYTGDVANKIGTYLKALAAKDNHVPFYVALPSSSFDWNINDGYQIPIEQRIGDEVKYIYGKHNDKVIKVRITPENSPVANYAFDITPSHLVTALITERGICLPDAEHIFNLFPEFRK